MRRLLKLSLIVAVVLGLAVWWWMPSKVERIPLGNIDPSFQGWCVTDLDGDGDAEILITYPRRTTILMGLQKDNLEFMDLHGFDSVVLPSSENPHSLLLPPAKAVPANKWAVQVGEIERRSGGFGAVPEGQADRPCGLGRC